MVTIDRTTTGRGLRLRRILVATRGSATSEGALRAARLLADRGGASVELLTVFEPRVLPPPHEQGAPSHYDPGDRHEIERLLTRVRAQRQRVLGGGQPHPIRLELGFPAVVIGRVARETDADLVVLGMGREDLAERRKGEETALKLAYVTDVPVLVVPGTLRELPRRAVVSVESVSQGVVSARFALGLLGPPAALCLARVCSLHRDEAPGPGRPRHPATDDELLEAVERRLGRRARPVVRRVTLEGDTLTQLIDLASFAAGDLLVVPVHGRSFAERTVMECVVDRLLRACSACVLLLPPPRSRATQMPSPALRRVARGEVSPRHVLQPGAVSRW